MPDFIDRRRFLALGALTLATASLAACTPRSSTSSFIPPTGAPVAETEAGRRLSGNTVRHALTAAPTTLDLGGTTVDTWAYRGASATEPIRAAVGDMLQVSIENALPEPTSIHWHGIALRNDMDGVPHLTQDPIAPGGSFTYEFALSHPGTYWFHPHSGTQLDRGLYAPLIIDDPAEPGDYDQEWILVLDDWLDGVTATPDEVLAELAQGMDMGGMDHGDMDGMDHGDMGDGGADPMRMGNMLMGATSDLLGGDAGDVYYPLYLINGRSPQDPATFTAKPGQRIRLRILNAGGDTAFRFGIPGNPLTITHTDGFPVDPVEAESVVLGMGERYDAVITVADGAFPMIAEAIGKQQQAMAILRTGSGAKPPADAKLPQSRRPAMASDLRAASAVGLKKRSAVRTLRFELTGGMAKYDWGINGRRMDMEQPLRDAVAIAEGERVAVEFVNSTTMWHPMHLHGHTYQHADGGPRKDTSIVLPGQTLRVEFDADNPGQWLTHCHNLYHGESGMMATVAYEQR
ncbi:multicopper oxidase family protein [Microbacterium sp. H1-D42]|uniref:multicopper oxidase family protein n=1 Tax=Microbacterium sp. H1-D42 TaxID=2925844 RepID=UPI001F53783F|nr:multicopper oxidase family protein [Microbacterium sp. H1-D42]UNK70847.1 multicopper oxidase family protein [Microbacterium sp. H1-D42]